jgi:drug/metabolite transporter (DMT)-like permease
MRREIARHPQSRIVTTTDPSPTQGGSPLATAPAARDATHAFLRLTAGAVLISFAPVFVKLADVGPTPAAFYRLAIGGAVLAAIVLLRARRWWAGGRHLAIAVVAGAFLAVDLALWHRSINLVGPGLATILANLQVFVLAGFGVVLLRERLSLRLAVGIVVALAGLYLIFGLHWRALGSGYRLGVLFGVLTAVCYASYLLSLRSARSRGHAVDAMVTVATLSLVAAVLLALLVWSEGETFRVPDARNAVILVGYAVVPQVAGWVLISTALPRVPASRAGLVLLLQPSLAFVWDVVLFRRPTTAVEVVGALLTLGAIYLGSTERRQQQPPSGSQQA